MQTLEIAGRAIAAMNAPGHEAEGWFLGDASKEDLIYLEDADGRPLWDGKARLFVRNSSSEEILKWEAGFAHARSYGAADPERRDGYVIYLINFKDHDDLDPGDL
jgi:hypothetical protein